MKKNLPGILCLLAMPCSILIFVKVQSMSGDLLALLAAVLFYIAVIVVCALVFNKPDPRNVPMEHPIIKNGEKPVDGSANSPDAAGSSKTGINDVKKED